MNLLVCCEFTISEASTVLRYVFSKRFASFTKWKNSCIASRLKTGHWTKCDSEKSYKLMENCNSKTDCFDLIRKTYFILFKLFLNITKPICPRKKAVKIKQFLESAFAVVLQVRSSAVVQTGKLWSNPVQIIVDYMNSFCNRLHRNRIKRTHWV